MHCNIYQEKIVLIIPFKFIALNTTMSGNNIMSPALFLFLFAYVKELHFSMLMQFPPSLLYSSGHFNNRKYTHPHLCHHLTKSPLCLFLTNYYQLIYIQFMVVMRTNLERIRFEVYKLNSANAGPD